MAARRDRSRGASPAGAADYIAKAEEHYQEMLAALTARRWNSAALLGAHCAISAADAVLVREVGRRSAGEAHESAAAMLDREVRDPEAGKQAARLRKILGSKHVAAYESRPIREGECRELAQQAERFLAWARERLRP